MRNRSAKVDAYQILSGKRSASNNDNNANIKMRKKKIPKKEVQENITKNN